MMLREEIARAIEAISIDASISNAVGMQILAAKIARGEENMFYGMFDQELDLE